MHLVNAYLTEVEQHLPREQRSDIVGELRDDIMEQLHALEERAGRTADVDDERAVLNRLGHPLKVASSYKSRRYLIGPALYPAYLKTLQTSLAIVLATLMLLWVALGSESTGVTILKGFVGQAISISFWGAVVVTIVFWPLNVVVGGFFALHVFVLTPGNWRRWAACLELVLCAVLLVVLVGILLSGTLVSGSDSSLSQKIIWIDRTLHIVLVVVAGFTLWDGKLAYGRWHKPAVGH